MQKINFVALDCETTGVDSRKDNIIELGVVKFSLAENFGSFDSLFHSPTRIPQFVERLTGIQNSDLIGAPNFIDKKNEIANFIGEAILVGHNLPFDLDFLARVGLDLSAYQTLDTFLLAGLILPRGDSLGLESLAQKFKIFHNDAHRALADTEATRDLLRILVALAKSFPSGKWERIRDLNSPKGWPQIFAEIVLRSEIAPRELEKPLVESPAIREDIVNKLVIEFSGAPKILEIAARPAEIFAAAERLDRQSALFFGRIPTFMRASSTAQKLSTDQIFAPENFIDSQKLEKFLNKELSPTELNLAAKLILYSDKNRHELNLTRVENLLFDFVAAEQIPIEKSAAKILVGDHAAFEFENSDRLKIIADAAAFAENRIRQNSLDLDLPNLELLAPQFSEKIQIWWGLLGLLLREAAPQYGRLDFASASGLANFSKAIKAGQNLLAEISAALPPRVATALQNFIDMDSRFAKSLRSNALGDVIISIEPRDLPVLDFSQDYLLDGALDVVDDFAFVKKLFALPSDFPTEKVLAESCPRFFVAENFPDSASPQFLLAIAKFLLKSLPQFTGRTVLIFPNRAEADNFTERATAELDLSIFSRKIPSAEKLNLLEKFIIITTPGGHLPTVNFTNCVVVKIPFFVHDGDDWATQTLPATVLRFKKIWANFAASDLAEKFFALDSRLLGKRYGQNFLDAIPQKFEGVKISA